MPLKCVILKIKNIIVILFFLLYFVYSSRHYFLILVKFFTLFSDLSKVFYIISIAIGIHFFFLNLDLFTASPTPLTQIMLSMNIS